MEDFWGIKKSSVNWKPLSTTERERFTNGTLKIVYMSPNEYIERINITNRKSPSEFQLYYDKNKGRILFFPPHSEGNTERLKQAILSGKEMEMPWIEYRGGIVTEQEGFHRAVACKELGIREIPVIVYSQNGILPSYKKSPFPFQSEIYGIERKS